MLTLDALRAFGANVDEGMNRCMNNEQFYIRLIGMALADPSFEKLEAALAAGDVKAAFEAAHALKGVLGNLSLTTLYTPTSELTERLRAGTATVYEPYLQEILSQREKLKALCD